MQKLFFISHSSEDKVLARRFKKIIESTGHRVWLDEADLKYGEHLLPSISEAINLATDFMLIASKDSMLSPFVWEEVHLARSRFETSGIGIYVVKDKDDVKLPIWLQSLLYLSLDSFDIKHKLRKFFFDATGQTLNELMLEEISTLIIREDSGGFDEGWQGAEEFYKNRLSTIAKLLQNARPDELDQVSNQILELGIFQKLNQESSQPAWVNLEPGVFELILAVPMRVPPKVEFYKVPPNLQIQVEHASNISVRFRFTDLISGLPTNDVPFSRIEFGLDAEL